MDCTSPDRPSSRTVLRLSATCLVIATSMIGFLGQPSMSSSQPSMSSAAPSSPGAPAGAPDRPIGGSDGVLPPGATVFDDRYPGIANLAPDLLQALREAARDAARSGIVLQVNSGWRSPDYQAELLREAIATYGSEELAARWVAGVEASAHVSGDAVDIGPAEAAAWLSRHGVEYGLCPVYRNEPWHYELRPEAIGGRCPPLYADPTQDPRMQR